MNSGIYVGSIRHRRFTPVSHEFVYPLFMPLIDLDELEELTQTIRGFGLSRLSFARFKRTDYMQGECSLREAVRDKVEHLTGERVGGKILMLCQLRYCGFYFSPLNLYYLYDKNNKWRYMLAEVSNTPWNERHYYVIPAVSQWQDKIWSEPKAFHVSPFNPMAQQYQWRISEPGDRVFVHMENHPDNNRSLTNHSLDNSNNDGKIFDATMALSRQPFTSGVLLKLLLKTPVMAAKVVFGIYWQALRLWIKGAPFYPHPASEKDKPDGAVSDTEYAKDATVHKAATRKEKLGAHDVKK